ncbi:MAG: Lrp/AsnC ligand binding domain-containing protein [Candidatus Micrarchaeia archaeon]
MDNKNNGPVVAGKQRKHVKKGSTYYKFFLIKPKPNVDVKGVAEKLIAFNDVSEVYVTEGSAGFMVKAKLFDDSNLTGIENFIRQSLGRDYGILISPMQYAKVVR